MKRSAGSTEVIQAVGTTPEPRPPVGEDPGPGPPHKDHPRDGDGGQGVVWGGRIRPGEKVGQGATGAVLRGTDIKLRRDVAVKVTALPRGELPTQDFARFVEEAQITAQLEHPNVVPVHDFGVNNENHAYFTMKLVRGQSLEKILAQRRAGDPATTAEFGLRRLLDVFLQVCRAVEYAHAHGVVHRDLKPANIMVGGFGEVLVMDWGIAKVMGRSNQPAQSGADEAAKKSPKESDISSVRDDAQALATQHGMVFGTPFYMSPEQARGLEVDERSDLYSLGVILYEILCGRVPFEGEDVRSVLTRLLSEAPRPPSEHEPRTPRDLELLVMHLLQKDPNRRTLDFSRIRSLIDDYIEGIGHEYRRESWWTNILWLLGALGFFSFLVWYLTGQSVATVVALTPAAVFNGIGWLLLVMALGYPLWFSVSQTPRDPFRPPAPAEIFVSNYTAHRTFSTTIAPLFQLIFIGETFLLTLRDPSRATLAQLRAEWANSLIVIVVFLFFYLFLFTLEIRFARRIDRYLRLAGQRRAWESTWPFVLVAAVLFMVIAVDVLDWISDGAAASKSVRAYVNDRMVIQSLHLFDIVKTLVFQGTFLVGLVIVALLLAFPRAEVLAALRVAYQPMDHASVASRERYFMRSLAIFRSMGTNALYTGALMGALFGLTSLSDHTRMTLLEHIGYVAGPPVIGLLCFWLTGRRAAAQFASTPALRRMIEGQLVRARREHTAADLEQLQAVPYHRRLLQLVVPLACIVGFLIWSGSGVHQQALRELILPVSTKGWLLILPYALLVVVLLVRDPLHIWVLRRRGSETAEAHQTLLSGEVDVVDRAAP